MTEHFLDDLRTETTEIAEQAVRLRDELGAEQLAWKPDPDTWSVAEVFQHLVTTGGLYEPGLQSVLAKARQRGGAQRRPFEARRFARWFVRMAGPDTSKKLKAPKRFRPTASQAGGEALDAFLAQQEGLASLIDASRDADLNAPRFGSPITPLIRFSLGEALLLMVRHQQRHLAQADRLTRHEAFPGSA